MSRDNDPKTTDTDPRLRRKPRLPRELSQRRKQLPPRKGYRDLVVAMRHPFVVLSNRRAGRRTPGVSYQDARRGFFIHATAYDDAIGVATIEDWDFIIFAVSELMRAFNQPGQQSVATLNPTITFKPRDILAAIRRPEVEGGAPIDRLEAGLKRLENTRVRLIIRGRKEESFTLLESYHRGRAVDEGTRPDWSLTVPRWMVEEITRKGGPFVARIDPAYFDLGGSPLVRVVARWAVAYRRYEPGPPVSIRLVRAFKLSGMATWPRFFDRLAEIVAADPLPDHTLKLANTDREDGGELVIDVRPRRERKGDARGTPPAGPNGGGAAAAAPERGLLDDEVDRFGSSLELD